MKTSPKIIISFTSYPGRMKCIRPLLATLFAQTRIPDKIVMYLAEEEFPGRENDMPDELLKIIRGGGVIIRWCGRNLKPHNKYFWAFKDFPNDLVITVDDDMLYPPDMIETLCKSYKRHPKCVSAWRVHTVAVSDTGKILPHKFWTYEDSSHIGIPSHQQKATGVGGVLYPVHLFRPELLCEKAILETCPYADDLWLFAMELYSDIPVVLADEFYGLHFISGGQENALSFTNDLKNMNDAQMKNIIRWFREKYGFSLEEKIAAKNTGLCSREYLYETIRARNGEILHLKNKVKDAQRALGGKMTEEEQLRAEVSRLRAELSGVYGSRSWRVTCPLRIAGNAVRKLRRAPARLRRRSFHGVTKPEYIERIMDNRAYCAIPKREYPARLCAWYKENMGAELNLERPVTFNDKLNWLKLYDKNPLKTLCADKLLAPKWAKKRCPELHTVSILGVWKDARKIDFARLPQRFALKCNHGSGMNIIVLDKAALNVPEAVEKLNYWMQMDYAHWNHSFETHYSKIPRRIICEEFLDTAGGAHGLLDYKIHCFNGVPKFIQVIADRNLERYGYNQVIFDTEWNDLHIRYDGHELSDSSDIKKPGCLDKMLGIAARLSEPFQYVRVDLYLLGGEIYFGELTFTPAMGVIRWDPPSVNGEWGGGT